MYLNYLCDVQAIQSLVKDNVDNSDRNSQLNSNQSKIGLDCAVLYLL